MDVFQEVSVENSVNLGLRNPCCSRMCTTKQKSGRIIRTMTQINGDQPGRN